MSFSASLGRRAFLAAAAGLSACSRSTNMPSQADAPAGSEGAVRLPDYQPVSALRVSETTVERAKYPVIDVHTHLSWTPGLTGSEQVRYPAEPSELLPVMDRRNIRTMVNLTGGHGEVLEQVIAKLVEPHPGRFIVFTEPAWRRIAEADYPQAQADLVRKAHKAGAKGIKVLKTLGLYLREQITEGPLVKVDDARFDPMWEAAGALGMPIAIHTSDPEAFFTPIDPHNERYEELHAHPNWSFHGKDFPSSRELHESRLRVVARHPQTKFIALHVGMAEDLALASEWLDKHSNLNVEIGARIGELGRQPRASRKFFDRYQDRILFGTDAVPNGKEYPQQIFGDELYQIYFRFLETEDEYFDYAPAPVPPQGRWRIYGLGLPDPILRKVYYANAARLMNLDTRAWA